MRVVCVLGGGEKVRGQPSSDGLAVRDKSRVEILPPVLYQIYYIKSFIIFSAATCGWWGGKEQNEGGEEEVT